MENSKLKEELEYMIAISKMRKESDITMKNKRNFIIKKGIGIAACFAIIFSGIVHAKDIENYFKMIFNNSTEAIDKAVENGYVQQENMDYTYDKDIGIKVDNLVLDDLNLIISFNFETKKENVKSIRFNDFVITNDNDKVIYQSEIKHVENFDELPLYSTVTWRNQPMKLSDTTFTDSILIGLKQEIDDFQKIYIDVKTLKVIYTDDKEEIVNGNWKFNVTINDEMRKSINIKYVLSESNEYIQNCTGTLSPTGMIIELTVKTSLNFEEFTPEVAENFYLKNGEQKYVPEYVEFSINGNNQLTFHFNNISTFSNNIESLEFEMGLYDSSIFLIKND